MSNGLNWLSVKQMEYQNAKIMRQIKGHLTILRHHDQQILNQILDLCPEVRRPRAGRDVVGNALTVSLPTVSYYKELATQINKQFPDPINGITLAELITLLTYFTEEELKKLKAEPVAVTTCVRLDGDVIYQLATCVKQGSTTFYPKGDSK